MKIFLSKQLTQRLSKEYMFDKAIYNLPKPNIIIE